MTLEALARAMNLPLDVLNQIESGEMRLDAMIIAKAGAALDVGVFSLFDAGLTPADASAHDLEDIRITCVGELMQVSDLLTLRLVLTLLWIMREEGVEGLSALSDQARSPHRPQH